MIKLKRIVTDKGFILEEINSEKVNKELIDDGKMEPNELPHVENNPESAQEHIDDVKEIVDKEKEEEEKVALKTKTKDYTIPGKPFKESKLFKDRSEMSSFIVKLKEQKIKHRVVPLHEDKEGYRFELKYEKPLEESKKKTNEWYDEEEDDDDFDYSTIKVGDYVDFGGYGKLYICKIKDDSFWVTDDSKDAGNPDARGWNIKKDRAERIIRRANESLKESKRLSNREIYDILGIEKDNYADYKYLLPQFRELYKKHGDEVSIWLKGDAGISFKKDAIIDSTEDLVAVKDEDASYEVESLKEDLRFAPDMYAVCDIVDNRGGSSFCIRYVSEDKESAIAFAKKLTQDSEDDLDEDHGVLVFKVNSDEWAKLSSGVMNFGRNMPIFDSRESDVEVKESLKEDVTYYAVYIDKDGNEEPQEGSESKNREDVEDLIADWTARDACEDGCRFEVRTKKESLKEEKEEPKLETFDEQMDFLASDEQEAIDGYEKVLALVEDEHVKAQLDKILEEERAHKEFLEAVKKDKSLEYSHEEHEEDEEPEEDDDNIDAFNLKDDEVIVDTQEDALSWDDLDEEVDSKEEEYQVQFVDEDDEIYDGGTFTSFEEAKESAIDGYHSKYVGFVIYNANGDVIFDEGDLED